MIIEPQNNGGLTPLASEAPPGGDAGRQCGVYSAGIRPVPKRRLEEVAAARPPARGCCGVADRALGAALLPAGDAGCGREQDSLPLGSTAPTSVRAKIAYD